MSDIEVSDDTGQRRYEARIDGELAGYADYRIWGEEIEFPHTVTLPDFAGRGVASRIAQVSLDDARAAGRTVRPTCSFYARWIQRHPDYEDLLAG